MAAQATVIISRVDSNTKKYWAAFKRWKEWAKSHDLQIFPVKEAHFLLYMQSVGERMRSKPTVEKAYDALTWAHHIGDEQPPTESAAVKLDHVSRLTEATSKTNPEEKADQS